MNIHRKSIQQVDTKFVEKKLTKEKNSTERDFNLMAIINVIMLKTLPWLICVKGQNTSLVNLHKSASTSFVNLHKR